MKRQQLAHIRHGLFFFVVALFPFETLCLLVVNFERSKFSLDTVIGCAPLMGYGVANSIVFLSIAKDYGDVSTTTTTTTTFEWDASYEMEHNRMRTERQPHRVDLCLCVRETTAKRN